MCEVTLKTIIDKHLKDSEFVEEYEKQLLINELSKLEELAEKAGATQSVIARLKGGTSAYRPCVKNIKS